MGIVLKNLDCLDLLKSMPDASVDLMLTDPPYSVTACDWDKPINLAEMWLEWERVIKPNGAFVFTCQQPFTSELIVSRLGFFKYELIWLKSNVTGFLNANKKPLRQHENILLFCRGNETYNPQMFVKTNPRAAQKTVNANGAYGNIGEGVFRKAKDEDGFPRSVLQFNTAYHDREAGLHPTQKPVDLFRYLIQTYSNPGETVFDGYSGSGTTAIACIKEGRNFIGSELNKEYYDKSMERISIALSKPELFT